MNFLLYTNGKIWDYERFFKFHKEIYQTPIQYRIRYDDETFFEQKNKLAGRIFITTQKSGESAKEIEIVLIMQFKDDKIYRLWEPTFPDWSQVASFKDALK